MHIKPQTVIPANVKITKCPPGESAAKSVWSLERAMERKLEREAELKAKAERLSALLKCGVTVTEAMKMLAE